MSTHALELAPLVALGEQDVMTRVALMLPADLEYDTYESIGTALGTFDQAGRWWVGDWLVYGEERFPDRYEQAAHITGLSENTLLNRVWQARAIPAQRRNPNVGYKVHEAVAGMTAREQTRWLDYAEAHGSTVADLKAAIKAAAKGAVDSPLMGSDMPPANEVNLALLEEAAVSLVRNAEVAGENVIVRIEDFTRVKAALGAE